MTSTVERRAGGLWLVGAVLLLALLVWWDGGTEEEDTAGAGPDAEGGA